MLRDECGDIAELYGARIAMGEESLHEYCA